MATKTLTNGNFQLRLTYTAKNGTLTITEIEGMRTDGIRSWNTAHTSLSVSVGSTSKSISLSHYIDFNASWTKFGATNTSWTGLSGDSISISTTMPNSTTAYDGLKFSGTVAMSLDTYTISYDANGGSNGPGNQTKTYGQTLTLSSGKPSRTGYTFKNWNIKSDGSGTSYNSGSSYTSNSNATLYAQWKENTLTISYYGNGATGLGSNESTTTYNPKSNLTSTIKYSNRNGLNLYNVSSLFKKDGYTRSSAEAAWRVGSATASTYWSEADGALNIPASYFSNETNTVNLYANWSENVLTVNYYSNYATESFADALNTVGFSKNVIVRTVTYKYDDEYPNGQWDYSYPTASTYLGRIGYTATGNWGTSENGGNLVSEKTSYSTGQALAEAVGKSLKTGNATINLYPQWEINTYTIDYNSNGGSGDINPQTVEWNELFTFSKNTFVREGYKFIGWNLYRNDDSKWYVESEGWKTEDEILANEYVKRTYVDQRELTLDESWIRGNEFSTTKFTLYAVWEISGVVYIDNGTALEPYLVYVDNGTGWDLHIAYIDNGTDWDLIS